jgi:HEAT repeat protein
MNKEQDDLARYRLGTAGRCLADVRPELRVQVSYQTLATQIPTEAFTVWKAKAEHELETLIEASLGGMWVGTEIGQEKLLELLNQPNRIGNFSGKAVATLGSLGWGMPIKVQEELVAQLMKIPANGKRNRNVWEGAAEALGKLGPSRAEVVEQKIIGLLTDKDVTVRAMASKALGGLGAANVEIVRQALLARLEDEEPYVRVATVQALGVLETPMPETVRAVLLVRLMEQNFDVRLAAARTLTSLGMVPPELLQQEFEGLLTDSDTYVRETEHSSYREGPMSVPVQNARLTQLTDQDVYLRMGAVLALGTLGTSMPAVAQQALVERLRDQAYVVQSAAGRALKKLGGKLAKHVLDELHWLLNDENFFIRLIAAQVLASAQKSGLRLFRPYVTDRLVSDLGAATLLDDGCGKAQSFQLCPILTQDVLVVT